MSQKKLTPSRRDLLREKLPYLNFNQVRRAKLPFHDALLAELKEADFHSSYELFNSLITIDLQGQKELVRDKKLLEDIFNSLIEMENASSHRHLQLLLKLSNRLSSQTQQQPQQPSQCPAWVVDELFKRALSVSLSQPLPLQHENTLVQISIMFSYGKWLSDKKGRLDEAICHLNCALKASKDDGGEIDLQNQIVAALCDTLKIQSIEITKNSPLQALKLSEKALNFALEYPNAITTKLNVEIKIQISHCCILLREFESAQIILEQSFKLTERAKLHEFGFKILKLQIELCSIGSRAIENDERELKLLKRAQHFVKTNCSTDFAAEAEVLILRGRFYCKKQIYSEALESFEKAVKIYERTNEMKQIWEVSFMMALLKGLFLLCTKFPPNNAKLIFCFFPFPFSRTKFQISREHNHGER